MISKRAAIKKTKRLKKILREYYLRKIYIYKFNSQKFEGTFLARSHSTLSNNDFLQPIVFCFWTGNNEMSKNRLECLYSMKKNIGVPIKLITPNNIGSYTLNQYPLHPSYKHLSLVHKADYLRCYFMHHFGGGYADIKQYNNSWVSSFRKINNNPNKWCLGYSELNDISVAPLGGELGRELKRLYPRLLGNGSYIFRPKSGFTEEWYKELHNRLDQKAKLLEKYPGNQLGDNNGYPFKWTEILGDIFHPLCLKHFSNLLFNDSIKADFNKKYK